MATQEHGLAGQGIWLKHIYIPYTTIVQGNFPGSVTADESQALLFYREWLSGKKQFTLTTSGSTGLPKPIQISRDQMIQSAELTGKALALQAGDKALVNLNTRYIGGLMMLVRGLVLKLQVTIVPPFLLPLQEFPLTTHFDFLSFVPMQLQALLEQSPASSVILNRAKAILLGGAPVNTALEKGLQSIQAPVYHTYGMTETLSHIALKRLNGPQQHDYYTTLPGVEISTDERSCLVISPPFKAAKPVITNDRVQLLSADTFSWLGRIDNVINTGGVKVQAEQVEKAVATVLEEKKLNYRYFISALPDDRLGETVTLFLESQPLSPEQATDMLNKIAAHTSRYEKPTSVVSIPAFVETPSGKIDKLRTLQKYLHS